MVHIKTRYRRGVGSGFGNRFCALLFHFCQRREHDRQPATGVVVMPIPMMAANRAKHCSRLIPETTRHCQTRLRDFGNHEKCDRPASSAAGYKRTRLDNVDLSLHICPLDVLVTPPEDALDLSRGAHQPANHIVS